MICGYRLVPDPSCGDPDTWRLLESRALPRSETLAPMADALKAEGIATWNIEYRRLSQSGSGWPGTYLDISKGVEYLRSIAAHKKLDLTRVIVIGHSAGGHLAMWVAARSRLSSGSALYVEKSISHSRRHRSGRNGRYGGVLSNLNSMGAMARWSKKCLEGSRSMFLNAMLRCRQ